MRFTPRVNLDLVAMRRQHERVVEGEIRAGRMGWEPPLVLRGGDIFY